MNLNKKIRKFTGDGIRGYNEAINELVDATNWLGGIRVINGKPISESDQGPVIDLSQVSSTQNQTPWSVDPDGNSARWVKIYHLDFDGSVTGFTNSLYTLWTWVGIPPSPPGIKSAPIPWMVDPSNLPADWVVCADSTFWGTGGCPAGIGNFKGISYSANGPPSTTNPYINTGIIPTPPIVPPDNPPAFYLETFPASIFQAGLPNQPCLAISLAPPTGQSTTCNFTWSIDYDGTTVFSVSGSVSGFGGAGGANPPFLIDPTGWIYDPGGLPGYSQGSKKWIWQYQGQISTNTNPIFTETFSWSVSFPGSMGGVQIWNTNVLTK